MNMNRANKVNSFGYDYGQGNLTVIEVFDLKTLKKDYWMVSASGVLAFYDYIKPEGYIIGEKYQSRSGASGSGTIYSRDVIFIREVAYYREKGNTIGGDTSTGVFLPVTYDYGSGYFNYNCPIVFAELSDTGVPQAHFGEIKKYSVGREIETFILRTKNETLFEGSLRWELFTNGESGVIDALRLLLSYFYIDAFLEEEKETEWKPETKTPAEDFFLKGLSKFSKGGISMFFSQRDRKRYNGESYKDAEFFVQTNTWLPSGIELGNNYELYYRTNETDRTDAIVQKNTEEEN